MAKKESLILDTSILIDVHCGDLLKKICKLDADFIAADGIIPELKEPGFEDVLSAGLRFISFSPTDIKEIPNYKRIHPSLSIYDIFSLILARQTGGILLTGDSHLRNIATKYGLPVHGTLWLIDELVINNIISPKTATESLNKMLNFGSRLPLSECDMLKEKWIKHSKSK